MRPLRIDITGATDANGNASIPVKLPVTGEWHDVKFALNLPGPAEWAILVSGTAVTYGRGRRVTLGPELIQDGETVTVSVTGGPVKAQLTGSANGKSGTPVEIMSSFAPAPNTIALDTAQQVPQLVAPETLSSGASVNLPPLPAGTTYLSVFYQPSTGTTAEIIGLSPGFPSYIYYLETVPAAAGGILRYIKVDPAMDTSLRFNNNGPGTINSLEIAAHFDAHPPVDTLGNVVVDVASTSAAPALWQSPTASASLSEGATGTFTLVAGIPGQVIRVFGWSLASDGTAAGGVRSHLIPHGGANTAIAWLSANPVGAVAGSAKGVPLPVGVALDFVVDFLPATDSALAAVTYSQG